MTEFVRGHVYWPCSVNSRACANSGYQALLSPPLEPGNEARNEANTSMLTACIHLYHFFFCMLNLIMFAVTECTCAFLFSSSLIVQVNGYSNLEHPGYLLNVLVSYYVNTYKGSMAAPNKLLQVSNTNITLLIVTTVKDVVMPV